MSSVPLLQVSNVNKRFGGLPFQKCCDAGQGLHREHKLYSDMQSLFASEATPVHSVSLC